MAAWIFHRGPGLNNIFQNRCYLTFCKANALQKVFLVLSTNIFKNKLKWQINQKLLLLSNVHAIIFYYHRTDSYYHENNILFHFFFSTKFLFIHYSLVAKESKIIKFHTWIVSTYINCNHYQETIEKWSNATWHDNKSMT